MPRYWTITDRAIDNSQPTTDVGDFAYWTGDKANLDPLTNWTSVSAADFQKQLIAATDQFPTGHVDDSRALGH
jgi:hypothetical protein